MWRLALAWLAVWRLFRLRRLAAGWPAGALRWLPAAYGGAACGVLAGVAARSGYVSVISVILVSVGVFLNVVAYSISYWRRILGAVSASWLGILMRIVIFGV